MIRTLSYSASARVAVAALAFLALASCSDEPAKLDLPRRAGIPIIVVSFDALRADALGVYGYSRPTSPNIDRFAESALVFEEAYTVAPVSPTSFASAWTGMLPTRVFHAWELVSTDTLASKLSAGGYTTAAFINNVQVTPERHFDVGWTHYDFHRNDPEEDVLNAALTWLGEHRDEQFFVWIHFLTPHAPYIYREMAKHLYTPGYEGRFDRSTGTLFEIDDPRDLQRARDLYDGNVLYSDSLFGQLLDGLEEIGLRDRAVIMLTSDHGEEFDDHGGLQHGELYEEHVRIPMLIDHPDAAKGSRTEVIFSNVDLLPTILSIGGVEGAGPVDGHDLRSFETPPDTVLGVSMTSGSKRLLSIRKGDHKLIQRCTPERREELYDLAADPGEQRSLAAAESWRVEQLSEEMETILGGDPCEVQQAAVRGAAPTVGLTKESVDALRALGYLDD